MRAITRQFTLVLLISCQLAISCTHTCPTIVMDSVGTFDSEEAGARVAVPRLSQAIHRCSEAKKYSVGWRLPPNGPELGWRALIYDRRDKTSGVVGYEYDVASGIGSKSYWVDDSAVDQVARDGGTLSDFAKYQKKEK